MPLNNNIKLSWIESEWETLKSMGIHDRTYSIVSTRDPKTGEMLKPRGFRTKTHRHGYSREVRKDL